MKYAIEAEVAKGLCFILVNEGLTKKQKMKSLEIFLAAELTTEFKTRELSLEAWDDLAFLVRDFIAEYRWDEAA